MARAALSLPFSGLSGSLGSTVIVQQPDGPVVRQRKFTRRASSPAQRANEARMTRAAQAWAALDDATFEAWGRYAETRAWRNPATGAIVRPKAFNLFVGLASKARQVDPTLDLSAFGPPEGAFLGDGVAISLPLGRGRGGVEGSSVDGTTPTLPSPRGEESSIVFESNRPNALGIVTELLIQPLANARRTAMKDRYVSAGFVAMDGEPVAVAVPAGAYACAYRFVRAATGEETALAPLGTLVVGAWAPSAG